MRTGGILRGFARGTEYDAPKLNLLTLGRLAFTARTADVPIGIVLALRLLIVQIPDT
jgi:hypothetical protein